MKLGEKLRRKVRALFGLTPSIDQARLDEITARLRGAPYMLALLDPQGFELSGSDYSRVPFDPSRPSKILVWRGLSAGSVIGGWRVYGHGPFNGYQGQFPNDHHVGHYDETLTVNFSGDLFQ